MKKIILLIIVVGILFFLDKLNIKEKENIIGFRKLEHTPLNKGVVFISPNGDGKECSESKPCNFSRLNFFSQDKILPNPGDVVFFREGIYSFTQKGINRVYLPGGTKGKPITYESYPNETVIFDGSKLGREDSKSEIWREGRLELRDSYTILRKVEVRGMPQNGIRILGNHNIVEGCIMQSNALSGIEVFNLKDGYSTKATGGSFNIIRDNIVFNNSDVGLKHHNYNDGGNADGITIHSGVGNIIEHNTVYENSDDGIDIWKSMNTKVEYNFVYKNGKGSFGDGNGIKLGGAAKESPLGANAVAQYNISFQNRKAGFTVNAGKNLLIQYNTSYGNEEYGYTFADDTKALNNISYKNRKGDFTWSSALVQKGNSWQLKKQVKFLSLDNKSENFLKLIDDKLFKNLGAYRVNRKED